MKKLSRNRLIDIQVKAQGIYEDAIIARHDQREAVQASANAMIHERFEALALHLGYEIKKIDP